MTDEELTRIMDEIKLVEKAFDRYKAITDGTVLILSTALKDCIDSLEYVNKHHPEASGYGVRNERIAKATDAINKAGLL